MQRKTYSDRGFLVNLVGSDDAVRVTIGNERHAEIDSNLHGRDIGYAEAWAEIAVSRLLTPATTRIPEYP